MRKRILTLGIAIALMTCTTMQAVAAESNSTATVTLTADEKMVYGGTQNTQGGKAVLGDSFNDIAPGDTASQTITLKNENNHKADFYINASTVEALEDEAKNAKGAGYDIKLSAGGDIIYDSTAGGYDADSSASEKGLQTMNDELGETWIMVGTLAKGQTKDVKLTIYFDGEAMDNTNQSEYTLAAGQLEFNFQASYKDPTGNRIVYKTVEKKGETKYVKNLVEIIEDAVPLAAVATGDNAMVVVGVAVLAAGIILVAAAMKKKKVEE